MKAESYSRAAALPDRFLLNVRMKGANQTAEDNAYRFRFTESQTAGEAVGAIPDLLGDFKNLLASAFADAARIAQCVVHGRFGDTKALGDGFHVQGFVGLHAGYAGCELSIFCLIIQAKAAAAF